MNISAINFSTFVTVIYLFKNVESGNFKDYYHIKSFITDENIFSLNGNLLFSKICNVMVSIYSFTT